MFFSLPVGTISDGTQTVAKYPSSPRLDRSVHSPWTPLYFQSTSDTHRERLKSAERGCHRRLLGVNNENKWLRKDDLYDVGKGRGDGRGVLVVPINLETIGKYSFFSNLRSWITLKLNVLLTIKKYNKGPVNVAHLANQTLKIVLQVCVDFILQCGNALNMQFLVVIRWSKYG